MPKKEDIAERTQGLRSRIYHLEQKHATAYPDEREALAEEIEGLIAEYEALLPAIEEEVEKRKAELLRGWDALNRDRLDLVRLLGQMHGGIEPVPKDANGMARQMGDPRWPFTFVQKLGLAPLDHYQPDVWDQRKRNEKAGKGYLTDEAVKRVGTVAQHGAGAKLERFPNFGGDR